MMPVLLRLLLWISVWNMVACTSSTPFELAKQGPTMQQNYQRHAYHTQLPPREGRGGTLAMMNDLNQDAITPAVARRTPNPELEMYVFPHRATKQGIIVPGYSVRFPMYNRVHYELLPTREVE